MHHSLFNTKVTAQSPFRNRRMFLLVLVALVGSACLWGCKDGEAEGEEGDNPMAELVDAERVDVTFERRGQQITVGLPEGYEVQERKSRKELVPASGREPGPTFVVSPMSLSSLEKRAEGIQGTRVKERKEVEGAHIVLTQIGSTVDVYVFAPAGEQGVSCRGSYKGKEGRDEAIEFIEDVCRNAQVK